MKVNFVDIGRQTSSIREEINKAIARVIDTSGFILGEEVELFEKEFANYCGVKYAAGVDSGVSALELSLRALGIKEDDEVITQANTFIATVGSVAAVGAKPVLVDINPENYNLNIEKIKEKITSKTKAIIPVHLYGNPTDMDEIKKLADKYKLNVIEDACQAHGAKYKGKRIGSFGELGCFSFYPGKNLGCYDSKTEIFTDSGWKYFRDLTYKDKVATLKNNKMVFENPRKIMVYEYNGEMFSFKNNAIDLLVTPNHNMYIKTWEKPNFYLRPAWDLIRSSQWSFKSSFNYSIKNKDFFELPAVKKKYFECAKVRISIGTWLEFLGYYISEGSLNLNHGHKIQIDQSKNSSFYKDISACLNRLPFRIYKEKDETRFSFYSYQLFHYLKDLGKSNEKFIPREFKNLSPEKLRILLFSLIKGDGSFRGKDNLWKYYTTSKRLADDVQEIALKCGIYATINFKEINKKRKKDKSKYYDTYTVCFNINSNKTMVRRKHVKIENYNGKIYCCENSTHVLYIRRNGRCFWCGNSFGDGGIVVSNNEGLINKIKMMRNYGQSKKYYHDFLPFNKRLDSIQAAILRVKLKHLDEWNEKRRKNAKIYDSLLKDLVITPKISSDNETVYHLYVIQTDKRDELLGHLSNNGIGVGVHYPIPIHLQKSFSHLNLKEGEFLITEKIAKRIISLPMFPELKKEEIEYVCEKVKEVIR